MIVVLLRLQIAAKDDDGLWRCADWRRQRQVAFERDKQTAAHRWHCQDQQPHQAHPGHAVPKPAVMPLDQQTGERQNKQ